eukprot:TRINITY_DN4593_c1_g1_i1.p2 TRINITY_DN4593_c1_g1~~TRINITY_DN4593_c1_g1_i1.p2  ORF type:complete len:312 (+),score=-26.75 TRINITY_DN4593_c1_g1_i1:683-1618(+)
MHAYIYSPPIRYALPYRAVSQSQCPYTCMHITNTICMHHAITCVQKKGGQVTNCNAQNICTLSNPNSVKCYHSAYGTNRYRMCTVMHAYAHLLTQHIEALYIWQCMHSHTSIYISKHYIYTCVSYKYTDSFYGISMEVENVYNHTHAYTYIFSYMHALQRYNVRTLKFYTHAQFADTSNIKKKSHCRNEISVKLDERKIYKCMYIYIIKQATMCAMRLGVRARILENKQPQIYTLNERKIIACKMQLFYFRALHIRRSQYTHALHLRHSQYMHAYTLRIFGQIKYSQGASCLGMKCVQKPNVTFHTNQRYI